MISVPGIVMRPSSRGFFLRGVRVLLEHAVVDQRRVVRI